MATGTLIFAPLRQMVYVIWKPVTDAFALSPVPMGIVTHTTCTGLLVVVVIAKLSKLTLVAGDAVVPVALPFTSALRVEPTICVIEPLAIC